MIAPSIACSQQNRLFLRPDERGIRVGQTGKAWRTSSASRRKLQQPSDKTDRYCDADEKTCLLTGASVYSANPTARPPRQWRIAWRPADRQPRVHDSSLELVKNYWLVEPKDPARHSLLLEMLSPASTRRTVPLEDIERRFFADCAKLFLTPLSGMRRLL